MGGRSSICQSRFGTSFEAKHWLSLDICGMLGISCSWGIHFYALAVIALKLLANSTIAVLIYVAAYIPIALLAMTSLYMATTTDPGAVPLGARPLVRLRRAQSSLSNNSSISTTAPSLQSPSAAAAPSASASSQPRALRRCHKCQDNYKPDRAHHDSVTGRCIVKFDHFCPWINNAVGALNHKFFCLFLLYTACNCILALLLLLIRVNHCLSPEQEQKRTSGTTAENHLEMGANETNTTTATTVNTTYSERFLLSSSSSMLSSSFIETTTAEASDVKIECRDFYSSHLVLGLLIASLLFLIFTASMACEQVEAIRTGRGKIARMKMQVGQSGTEFSTVTEEFNEMFGGTTPDPAWHWFWPRTVQYPRGMKKVILGFEWDESLPPEPYQENGSTSAGVTATDRELQEMEIGITADMSSSSSNSSSRRPVLSRQSSEVSNEMNNGRGVKNRKGMHSRNNTDDEEGLTLVDRSRARLS